MSSTSGPLNSLYSLNGIPLFTYGMIGITTFALACITMLDDSNKSYAKDEGFLSSLNTSESTSGLTDTLSNGITSVSDSFSNIISSPEDDETKQKEQEEQEKEQLEKEQLEKEQLEKEQLEKEQLEKEQKEKDKQETPTSESPMNIFGEKKGGKKQKKTKSNIKKYKNNKTKSR